MFAAKSRDMPQKDVIQLPVGDPRLSVDQHKAIQLLLSGRTINETAAMIGKSRDTVSRWKNESPIFIAALNERRQELLEGIQNRLHSMVSKAVDVMEKELDNGNLKAATELLKLVNVQAPLCKQETDPELIAKSLAEKLTIGEFSNVPFISAPKVPTQLMKDVASDLAYMLKRKYDIESGAWQMADSISEA